MDIGGRASLLLDRRPLAFRVTDKLCRTRPLVSGLWSLVSGLWSLVSGLWSLVSGLWGLGSGV